MVARGKKKQVAKKKTPAKKPAKATRKKAATRKAATKKSTKKAPAKRSASKKTTTKRTKKATAGVQVSKKLGTKAASAVKKAAEALWGVGVPPHHLIQEVHEVLLLKCLKEADGNYAAAATLFGPSRQSVQQYANSTLRDDRWKPYQQNRRKRRG